MKLVWKPFYTWLGLLCALTLADQYRDSTRTLNRLFHSEKYDKRLRPLLQGPPVNVTVDISIVSIGGINELHMDFLVDMFFRQSWKDPRLMHNFSSPLILREDTKNRLWIPDTYFLNVRTASFHNVPSPNSRLRLWPNGDIEYSTRITLTASCLMDFRNYPMDTQICSLEMESYSYDTSNIDYYWKNDKELAVMKKEMPEYQLLSSHKRKGSNAYPSGTFACLSVQFTFKRRVGYSLLQIYAPTSLIVSLSWLSFWISKDAVPARVALGVTTVLTIVTLMGSVRTSVPKVSYIKALDWYLIFSFLFVLGSVLEYVTVILRADKNNLRDMKGSTKSNKVEREPVTKIELSAFDGGTKISRRVPRSVETSSHEAPFRNDTSTIDRVSRILFPLAYFIFNFIYWLLYLS